jgi:hypothetical protein
MKRHALRVVVADLEQGHPVGLGVGPQDPVRGPPADRVLVRNVLVVAADVDL